MNLFIDLAVYFIIMACTVVFAWMLTLGFAVVTEKALDTSDQIKQARKQESERAQEPQNVLLRAGMTADAQPQTLVRPVMADEEAAPETLLRPVETGEREQGTFGN